jgi:hypothetical protein
VDDLEATIMRINPILMSLVSGTGLEAFCVTGNISLRPGVRREDNGMLGAKPDCTNFN